MKKILQSAIISLALYCIIAGVLGCDAASPRNITGSVVEDVDPDVLMNAAVVVLIKNKFSIATSDAAAGLVTTNWRSETSWADQVMWGQAYQIRATVVVDFFSNEVTVQMERQVKEYLDEGEYSPWRTVGVHKEDKQLAKLILTEIQLKAHDIQDRG